MSSKNIYSILSSKPHNPHYLNRYWKFIQSFQYQIKINGKTECHHICPKSDDLFPEYAVLKINPWNGVHLTYRQHFIAHWMLAKAYGNSQIFAFWAMCHKMSNGNYRTYRVSSYIYNNAKIKYQERNKTTNPFNNPEFQQNLRNILSDTYGVVNQFQLLDIKEKSKKTCLLKYGVEYASQSSEFKENVKNTNRRNLGVDYPMQSKIVKEKTKESYLAKYGVINPSQFSFLSIIETKKTYSKNIISRLYPELKKFY